MDLAGADAVISTATRGKLLVFAVFLVGLVTGGLLYHLYETRWDGDPETRRSQQEINRVYEILDLTSEQQQQIKSIVEASRPDFEKLFAENRELLKPNQRKFAELQEQNRAAIRKILTDGQAKEFDAMNERRQRRGQPGPPKSR